MSYRCQICKTVVEPNQPLRRHIVYRDRRGNRGVGKEIEREIPACYTCWYVLEHGVPLMGLLRKHIRPLPPLTPPPTAPARPQYEPIALGIPQSRR